MLGWLRRRSKGSEVHNGESGQLLDSLKGKLARMNQERDAEASDSTIVRVFAEVLERSSERILDAGRLPFPKSAIREAFDRRIRFFERWCVEEPDNLTWKKDLEWHRAVTLRVSDFQEIDREDEKAVLEANAGRLGDRKSLLLFLKYHERAMKEDGVPVNDPLEREGERVPFHELCRRKGVS